VLSTYQQKIHADFILRRSSEEIKRLVPEF